MIEILDITNNCSSFKKWLDGFSLWYEDLEEAGVEEVYAAICDGAVVGFQAVDADNRCIAIEVADSFQGQGISKKMIEASCCNRPAENENPDFWEVAEDWV